VYQNLKKGRLAATEPLPIDVCIDSYPEAPIFILPVVNFVLGFTSNHFHFQLISHPTDIIMPNFQLLLGTAAGLVELCQ